MSKKAAVAVKAPKAAKAAPVERPVFREDSLPGKVFAILANEKPVKFEKLQAAVSKDAYLPSILYGIQKRGAVKGFSLVYGDGVAQLTMGKKQDLKLIGNSNTPTEKAPAKPKAAKAPKVAKVTKAAPPPPVAKKKTVAAAPAAAAPAPVKVNAATISLVRRTLKAGPATIEKLLEDLDGSVTAEQLDMIIADEANGVTNTKGTLSL